MKLEDVSRTASTFDIDLNILVKKVLVNERVSIGRKHS
jgi:hypothetical protein